MSKDKLKKNIDEFMEEKKKKVKAYREVKMVNSKKKL